MNDTASSQNQVIDLEQIIRLIRKKWYLFGISIFIAIGIAFIVNYVSPRVYKVSTSVVINEDKGGMANASAQLLQDIGFVSVNKNFANEMQVLKSTPLIRKAVERLDFQISYYEKKNFRKRELYKGAPFVVIPSNDHPQAVFCEFQLSIIDNETYRISCNEKEVQIMSLITEETIREIPSYNLDAVASFGKFVATENFKFKVILNSNFEFEDLQKSSYSFRINSMAGTVKVLQQGMEVFPPELESTVAEINMKTSVPQKMMDYLNSLTYTYSRSDLERKNYLSEKTLEYINRQLNIIKDSLSMAEENLQRFRSSNELVDITVQSGHIFEELSELESQRAQYEVNLKYYDYIDEYFQASKEFSELIAPSAMGLDDPMLNNLVEELITLNAEKLSLIENNQEKSPYLKRINIRIENLKNMVGENISYYRETNRIALREINSRINQLNSEVRKLPRTQRELLGYERKFNINDAIYTYLLEKKSEAEIARASYQADIEVVEPAHVVGFGPLSPKPTFNYLIAVFLGLVIPLVGLQLFNYLKVTITDGSEVRKLSDLPILGKVFHNHKKVEDVVNKFPNTNVTESFKMLKLNLGYFLKSNSKIITVNSSISGEGKSFIALNLALTLANANFKTILLGFDLRRPRDFSPLAKRSSLGLSSYLSGQANLEDILQKTDKELLDIILSGPKPPNPTELLESKYTDELIESLSAKYDYIILDAPPMGIVSDGLLLMEKADLSLFIARLHRTPKKMFRNLCATLKERKLNMCLIINDVPADSKSKYGYGYYTDK